MCLWVWWMEIHFIFQHFCSTCEPQIYDRKTEGLPKEWCSYSMPWDLESNIYGLDGLGRHCQSTPDSMGLVERVGFGLEEKGKVMAGRGRGWVEDLRELKLEREIWAWLGNTWGFGNVGGRESVVGRIMPPPRCPYSCPRFCEYVTLHGRWSFACVSRLRTLRWKDFPGLSGWTQCPHKCPYVQGGGKRVKEDVTVEAELGGMGGKEMDHFLEPPERRQPCQHLGLSSVRPILDF